MSRTAIPLNEQLASHSVKIPFHECWEWDGWFVSGGYGAVGKGDRRTLAHRLAWTIHNGHIPDGMCVCHRCDNPACVRPDHLFLGTAADNAADRDAKDRTNPPTRKLTVEAVKRIRAMISDGVACVEVARRFGMSRNHVWGIASRKYWKSD